MQHAASGNCHALHHHGRCTCISPIAPRRLPVCREGHRFCCPGTRRYDRDDAMHGKPTELLWCQATAVGESYASRNREGDAEKT